MPPFRLRALARPAAGLKDARPIATCAGLRPDSARVGEPEQATKIALRSVVRRHAALTAEIDDLDALIGPLIEAIKPELLARAGVGTDVAGPLLVTAGQNTERLHSEPAFAMLCGAAPIPASSGKTHRHRLDRGGDRQANAALYRVMPCRMRWDPRTRAYLECRTKEGPRRLARRDTVFPGPSGYAKVRPVSFS